MAETQFSALFRKMAAPMANRQFGESLVYHAADGSTGNDGRTIVGQVERGALGPISELGEIPGQAIIITVTNDSVLGISSDEIDTGGDEVLVAKRAKDEASRRSIVEVLNDSGGRVRFLCQ